MKNTAVVLTISLLMTGCAALDPGAVSTLAEKEQAAFTALQERLADNRETMNKAASAIGEHGAEWAEKAFELERNMAKAKRLESMNAPWSSPTDEFTETQRSVVLYHLYEVELAEQKVLDARMAERRAAAQELLTAYDRFTGLLDESSDNLRVVLKYLNQPKRDRFLAFTSTLLNETTAFRQQLQQSENPRLKALAEDVARHETAALDLKQQANEALQAYFRLQELGN